jgi:5-methylcytosine-specific restriction endonuclease McrA
MTVQAQYCSDACQRKEARRRRRRLNPEGVAAAGRRYRQNNPDSLRRKDQRRRARKRSAFIEDVHPLVVLERDDGVCGICGGDVDPEDFHVDHIIPLARGGEHRYANVQPAHPWCNLSKCDRL